MNFGMAQLLQDPLSGSEQANPQHPASHFRARTGCHCYTEIRGVLSRRHPIDEVLVQRGMISNDQLCILLERAC